MREWGGFQLGFNCWRGWLPLDDWWSSGPWFFPLDGRPARLTIGQAPNLVISTKHSTRDWDLPKIPFPWCQVCTWLEKEKHQSSDQRLFFSFLSMSVSFPQKALLPLFLFLFVITNGAIFPLLSFIFPIDNNETKIWLVFFFVSKFSSSSSFLELL